jgi:tetratricopeptide (TPR) repeat protein
VPHDAAVLTQLTALRARVATQHALSVGGTRAEVVPALTEALADARALGYKPLEAKALMALALVQQSHDELALAEDTYNRALDAAEEGHFDLARAQAWRGLAFVYQLQHRYAEAHRAAHRAEAVLRPFGADAEQTRVDIAVADAMAYWGEKNYAEALARMEAAVEFFQKHHPDSVLVAMHLSNLGSILQEMGRTVDAQRALERALAIYRAQLGEDHLAVAKLLNNLGTNAFHEHRYADALGLLERALTAKEKLLPADNLSLGYALFNLAEAYGRLGRWPAALPLYERALPIVAVKLGLENDVMVGILTGIGTVAVAEGRPAQGIPPLERALALGAKAKLGPRDLAATRFALSRARDAPDLAAQAREADPETTADLEALLAARTP